MLNHKLVAVHQPNFLPWLGYFDKIRRSDVFIVLDDAQFSKTGGTWTNRVQIITNGEPAWLTMPVVRAYHGTRTIREMQTPADQPWREKISRRVADNYRGAPHFGAVFPVVRDLIHNPAGDIADYNLAAIKELCSRLGISTQMVFASELNVATRATQRLVDLLQAVHGSAYLAGGGAASYQDDGAFAEAGIELVYQEFVHPTYTQFNTTAFKAGMSIVDALMNCGFDGVGRLLAGKAVT